MNQHGRVWRVGADIDTDALAPGAYMKFGIDEIARHCLQRVRPDFAAGVRPGDVLVAGPNFGIGSSREQAAAAWSGWAWRRWWRRPITACTSATPSTSACCC